MCSCSKIKVPYDVQENINLNYNNISASYNNVWLTNESICYLEDALVQYYCLVSGDKKTKICSNHGGGSGRIQRYGNKIYMMEEYSSILDNSKYLLKSYDVASEKITNLFYVNNCDDYFVLGENVYCLQYYWTQDSRKLSLNKYLIGSKEHTKIHDSVISFGVIENNLVYITEENQEISIFKYDSENNTSTKCGQFFVEITDEYFTDYIFASYTSDYIFLTYTDSEEDNSTIFRYSFEESKVDTTILQGDVYSNFISYSDYSYFALADFSFEETGDSDKTKTEIYKMNNHTGEQIKLGQIQGECSIFVGSDDGVYVHEQKDRIISYFATGEEKKIVYRF